MLPEKLFRQPEAFEEIMEHGGHHQGTNAVESHEDDGIGQTGDVLGASVERRVGDPQHPCRQGLVLGNDLMKLLGCSVRVRNLVQHHVATAGMVGRSPTVCTIRSKRVCSLVDLAGPVCSFMAIFQLQGGELVCSSAHVSIPFPYRAMPLEPVVG